MLRRQRRTLPSQDPHDPNDRRLRYVRYADDWLLELAGPKHAAQEITSRLRAFLRDPLTGVGKHSSAVRLAPTLHEHYLHSALGYNTQAVCAGLPTPVAAVLSAPTLEHTGSIAAPLRRSGAQHT